MKHLFSILIVLFNGKPQNILINGDFYPILPEEENYVSIYEITSVADLNGDGKIEIIIGGQYSYGGNSTEVFEFANNKPKSILFSECGD